MAHADPRELHCLVHNVSHTDVILLVESDAPAATGSVSADCFAKPLFATFAEATRSLAQMLVMEDAPLRTISMAVSDTVDLPVGLRFTRAVELDAASVTLRTPPQTGAPAAPGCKVRITGILFPLIATLVPRWIAVLAGRSRRANRGATVSPAPPPARQIIYLVSGASVPDDPEYASGTSTTDYAASILCRFLRCAYVDVIVHPISSGADVFRFDDNASFFRYNINPLLSANVATLVRAYEEGWKKKFSVTISMAAGSPARLAALNSALRYYTPCYLHTPNVKAFWYTANLASCLSSIHFITFDEIEGTPAVAMEALDDEARSCVEEMRKHIARFCRSIRGTPDYRMHVCETTHAHEHTSSRGKRGSVGLPEADVAASISPGFTRMISSTSAAATAVASPAFLQGLPPAPSAGDEEPDHELAQFWLRKTRQPVLAVLLVRKDIRSPPAFYYGMNLEVSMPTGSICSERVAISSALAADPSLHRSHIRMVAVISMPKVSHPDPRVQAAYTSAGVGNAAAFYHPHQPVAAPLPSVSATAVALVDNVASRASTPGPAHSDDARMDTILMPPPPPLMARAQRGGVHPSSADAALGDAHAFTRGAAVDPRAHKRARLEWGGGGSETHGHSSVNTPGHSGSFEDMDAEGSDARSDASSGAQSHGKLEVAGAASSSSAAGTSHVPTGTGAHAHVGVEWGGSAPAASTPPAALAAPRSASTTRRVKSSSRAGPLSSQGRPTGAPTPLHRNDSALSFEYGLGSPRERANTSVVYESADSGCTFEVPVALNPIAPCGSCMEWLRKIAEVNPDFRILTFTDISCERVFVKPVFAS